MKGPVKDLRLNWTSRFKRVVWANLSNKAEPIRQNELLIKRQ
jgi:hypothetical protein